MAVLAVLPATHTVVGLHPDPCCIPILARDSSRNGKENKLIRWLFCGLGPRVGHLTIAFYIISFG